MKHLDTVVIYSLSFMIASYLVNYLMNEVVM